jgi:hypothetical protein
MFGASTWIVYFVLRTVEGHDTMNPVFAMAVSDPFRFGSHLSESMLIDRRYAGE